ncbi:MAG: hypothetical protein HPY52_08720 [Firmicutes bacterium]|nr:hypothetical protein [Bacillota bacterium]
MIIYLTLDSKALPRLLASFTYEIYMRPSDFGHEVECTKNTGLARQET